MDTKNQTILIIENAPTNDEAFRSILGKDHRLVFADGHQEVLEFDGHHDIDLVLLDEDTSGMDAGDIFSHLNANSANRNTEIILMVNKEQEANLDDLPVGVTDCIAKPLQPSIVMARVQRHLELKGYRDVLEDASTDGRPMEIGSPWKFDALLTREWRRALRSQTPISLVLIDIDFFKEFEALVGRPAGDNCLRLVGEALQECVKRDLDFIARHESHTFVCLLPDTDAVGAHRVCLLIQEKVAQLNIPHPCSTAAERVTLSIGEATVRPTFKLEQDYLYHQAEVLLEEGRNRSHNQARSRQR